MDLSNTADGSIKWHSQSEKNKKQKTSFFGKQKQLSLQLEYDLVIVLLGIYHREMKTYIYIKSCKLLLFMASLIVIAKNWKKYKCPSTDE